jgi:hypothetical protein
MRNVAAWPSSLEAAGSIRCEPGQDLAFLAAKVEARPSPTAWGMSAEYARRPRSGSSDRRVTAPGYSSGEQPSSDSSRTGRVLLAARQGRETPPSIRWLAQVSERRLICLAVLLVSIQVANLASGILLWLLYGAAAVGSPVC